MSQPFFAPVLYRSPVYQPSFSARCFTSSLFYMHLADIVIRAGLKAHNGEYTSRDWTNSSEEVSTLLERVGCRIEAEGMEHFRTLPGPCLFVGNHMSTLETFVLPALIQPWLETTFVVKASLCTYPFFGHVLKSRHPIVVGRTNPREDLITVLEQGKARLAAGTSIIIFPQSTRSPLFERAHFNSIGTKLAKRSGVPVVPFALKTDAWGTGHFIKDVGSINTHKTIHFRFGAPFTVTGSGKDEHENVCRFIEDALKEWGGNTE